MSAAWYPTQYDDERMYEWDDGNLDHIAEHGVESAEAQEALEDRRRTHPDVTSRIEEQNSDTRHWVVSVGRLELAQIA